MADATDFRRFVRTVARLNWDGEPLSDGSEYVQENDDARDTLMSLITWARDILAETQESEDKEPSNSRSAVATDR